MFQISVFHVRSKFRIKNPGLCRVRVKFLISEAATIAAACCLGDSWRWDNKNQLTGTTPRSARRPVKGCTDALT